MYLNKKPDFLVIPVMLTFSCEETERQCVPVRIIHTKPIQIERPVPDRDLNTFIPVGRSRIVHRVHSAFSAASVRIRHAGIGLNSIPRACAFGLTDYHITQVVAGCVNAFTDSSDRLGRTGVRHGDAFCVKSHGMFPCFLNTGSCQNVMEMRKAYIPPRTLSTKQFLSCHGTQCLSIQQRGLRPTVSTLDSGLRGITAGKDGIQLARTDMQLFTHRFRPAEIFSERAK